MSVFTCTTCSSEAGAPEYHIVPIHATAKAPYSHTICVCTVYLSLSQPAGNDRRHVYGVCVCTSTHHSKNSAVDTGRGRRLQRQTGEWEREVTPASRRRRLRPGLQMSVLPSGPRSSMIHTPSIPPRPVQTKHTTLPAFTSDTWLAVWLSGNAFASINVVALRQTRLVPGWVTVCGRVNHLGVV